MFLPGSDGELGYRSIEELNGTVTTGRQELVLVDFGPSGVIERVRRVKAMRYVSRWLLYRDQPSAGEDLQFFTMNSIPIQSQDVEAPVTNQAKVGRRRSSNPRINERRVLHGIAVEALRPEFQHCASVAVEGVVGTVLIWKVGFASASASEWDLGRINYIATAASRFSPGKGFQMTPTHSLRCFSFGMWPLFDFGMNLEPG